MLTLRSISARASSAETDPNRIFQFQAGVDLGGGHCRVVRFGISGLIISDGRREVFVPLGEVLAMAEPYLRRADPPGRRTRQTKRRVRAGR
jgi:hypothetical protein